MFKNKILGIDIGGTKISVGLIQGNAIVKKHTANTEAKKAQVEIIHNLFDAINQVWEPDIEGIGIGVPGLVDHENGIVYHLNNIPSWQEVKLRDYVEQKFRVPTFVNNDANCFALGVKYFGVGEKYKNFVAMTLGTGVGTGIIIHDKLYSGVYSGAGEFSSIPYRDSNYESYCSGHFFKNYFNLSGQAAFKRAKQGEREVVAVWEEYGVHLGHFMQMIMFSLAPEAIIIGGSISNGFEFFKDSLHRTIAQFPFDKVRENTTIECSNNSDLSIKGAGALYFNAIKSLGMF